MMGENAMEGIAIVGGPLLVTNRNGKVNRQLNQNLFLPNVLHKNHRLSVPVRIDILGHQFVDFFAE